MKESLKTSSTMKNFVVYDTEGTILRTGFCQNVDFAIQAHDDEFVMEGKADAVTQKVVNVGIKGKIVNKTPAEIEAEKPPEIPKMPKEKQPAYITNEQWQDVLNRLDNLEKD